jgi:alpha-L-fucosidase
VKRFDAKTNAQESFMIRPFLMPAVMFTIAGIAATLCAADSSSPPIADGPFKADLESLRGYHCPEWFRDAKFGIWAHWGPQAVPRQGDWYARLMYLPASDQKNRMEQAIRMNQYHLEHFGHPSEFGYKDIIPLWKAERWNPDDLMARYAQAGAKYFVSMGVHHDNFALWNSPLHRWNSVNMGPEKDVVGIWQAAARRHGLRFGVSEHLAASYTWFQSAHGSDASGPKAGVPYDGNDPRYQDLYHGPAAPGDNQWLTTNPVWQQEWFERIKELVDAYHPDLLYSDSKLPFGDLGVGLLAHYYNRSAAEHQGTAEVVYNCKQPSEGRWVQDLERGVMHEIQPEPWQTDTSIAEWFYHTGMKVKTATQVIHQLVDVVSKNGNLLINMTQTPEGDLDESVIAALDGITAWMRVNGEAIFATRPWKVYGEEAPGKKTVKSGDFNEYQVRYSDQDLRFTTSKDGHTLYVIALGWPTDGTLVVRSLAEGSPLHSGGLGPVRLLGGPAELQVKRDGTGLHVELPAQKPCASAYALAIPLL